VSLFFLSPVFPDLKNGFVIQMVPLPMSPVELIGWTFSFGHQECRCFSTSVSGCDSSFFFFFCLFVALDYVSPPFPAI